ncbi:RagB/SusD family nutrient uptake outer membrane protein [Sphingobacterium sp. SRCM116780]|uniref:RagB/SusD family nutrient uptake outer membrane protein n=1 Tax=Sphingobacterium sp. SRCM116780 TaxID=2907623 RepID=UPI001F2C6DDD|nr:RagB/SusD family nutrient uptake outer membrane protein [Sphingobacterium sp. SRCM116780]UIR55884.1 RagB/SusD family nutrient uptake outer membrane protein [Sphingobacterium sp. SRCM116780]
MKFKHIKLATLMGVFTLYSCNDNFLERYPTHDLNATSYWNTEEDLKSYTNGIYNSAADNSKYMFYLGFTNTAFGSATHAVVPFEVQSDNHASLASEHVTFAEVAAGRNVQPTNPDQGGWYWDLLRRINILLENYDKANIAQEVKNRYAGEAYFFRAWFYLDKVQRFGDVPYITKSLNVTDEEVFGARTPRKEVMNSVLKDIDQAIEFLPETWTNNRLNKYMALALKSRLCLYEGTFRKYHGLGDHELFLKASLEASKKIMDSKKYRIFNNGKPTEDYGTLFKTIELSTNPEIIMSRSYAKGVLTHNMSGYIATQNAGATKDFIDDFLVIDNDGLARPVGLSTSYDDSSIENVFKNRDKRLSQTVLNPVNENSVFKSNVGYPRLLGMGGNISATGYHLIKYFDFDQSQQGTNQDTDAPIFRYAEILLNYAEAAEELGQLDQSVLDATINQIRARAGMPNMLLNPVMDPKYAAEGISSNLVEIRRERRVELSYEKLRYHDLIRWKKGAYMAKKVLGMRFEESDRKSARYAKVAASVKTVEVNGKHYIDVYGNDNLGNRTFNEGKNYYFPIPVNVISKNPNITQNPLW